MATKLSFDLLKKQINNGEVDTVLVCLVDMQGRLMGKRLEAHYFAEWGLTRERLRLAAADAIVMHPQPMNRGVEIASDVADGPQSVIRDQVRNGVAVRMAVLETLLAGR